MSKQLSKNDYVCCQARHARRRYWGSRMAFHTPSVLVVVRRLCAAAVAGALILAAQDTRAQRQPLQERLSAVTALSCSFTTIANADWKNGAASASTQPVKLSMGFKN